MKVSSWKDKRVRIGWHIRLNNGKIGIVTWISNGQIMVKEIKS